MWRNVFFLGVAVTAILFGSFVVNFLENASVQAQSSAEIPKTQFDASGRMLRPHP